MPEVESLEAVFLVKGSRQGVLLKRRKAQAMGGVLTGFLQQGGAHPLPLPLDRHEELIDVIILDRQESCEVSLDLCEPHHALCCHDSPEVRHIFCQSIALLHFDIRKRVPFAGMPETDRLYDVLRRVSSEMYRGVHTEDLTTLSVAERGNTLPTCGISLPHGRTPTSELR